MIRLNTINIKYITLKKNYWLDIQLGLVSDGTLLVICPKMPKMLLLIEYYWTYITDDDFKFII